jgi:hypothetical protein
MRRAARVDANQEQVVSALRAAGAQVQSLAAIGKGVPDLLVSFRGNLHLLEIKDGKKPPSARKLTPDQQTWRQTWGAVVEVVTSPEQALKAIGAMAPVPKPAPTKVQRHHIGESFGYFGDGGGF